MYNKAHVFDLSFVAPNRRRRTKPQLTFTLKKKHLSKLTDRLQKISSRWDAENYLGGEIEFALPVPDLFGNIEFGYKRCGLVTHVESGVSLRLELSQKNLFCTTATLHVLTAALNVPFEPEDTQSNRSQQVDISTVCDSQRPYYGHALYGYVSAEIRDWLRKESAHLDGKSRIGNEAPPEIVAAMRQAWVAVVPEEDRRWASECSAWILGGARFVLNCMGNACDVAIYPDSTESTLDGSVEFSCHNLDLARQQVTLLAGLAKLCELARKDEL